MKPPDLIYTLSLLYLLFIFIFKKGIFGSENSKGTSKVLLQQKVPKDVIYPTESNLSCNALFPLRPIW